MGGFALSTGVASLLSSKPAPAGLILRSIDSRIERDGITPAGRFATALTFALTENWPGLVRWCRRDLSVTGNPAILALYLRALGETGALDDLVLAGIAGRNAGAAPNDRLAVAFQSCAGPGFLPDRRALSLGYWREISGRIPVDRAGSFGSRPRSWRQARAMLASERLDQLRLETRDAILRRSIDRRLAHVPAGSAPLRRPAKGSSPVW